MVEVPADPAKRAELYLGGRHLIKESLGSGTDGIVYSTTEASVIKVHKHRQRFENELSVYLRLRQHDVHHIDQFSIPQLRNFDTRLLLLEISHVRPPYLIDFGKSHLDEVSDFPPEAWQWWRDRLKEIFGDDFPTAANVYDQMVRKYGIYHLDLNPYNLRFRDE